MAKKDDFYRLLDVAGDVDTPIDGEDFRFIFKRILLMFSEVFGTEMGNSIMEVFLSRGGYKDLKDRLDAGDNDLRNISVDWINKNLGKLDQTYFTEETIQQWTGNTPVNAVPADGGVTTPKYAAASVTPEKLSFTDNDGLALAYERGNVLGADTNMGYANNVNSRSVFYQVEPDTTYTVSKDLSDRFRILSSTDYPSSTANFVRWIKQDNTTPNEALDSVFTFTTTTAERYIVITVSITNKEPRVHLQRGASTYDLDAFKVKYDISAKNIEKGKNLFDGTYHSGAVAGSILNPYAGEFNVISYPNARSIILGVEQNTDYSIFKTISHRFRVALAKTYPKSGTNIYILQDELYGGDTKTTLTVNSQDYNYLLITVFNKVGAIELPEFVQIEKGTALTELETYGYKFYPEAKPLSKDSVPNVISVESFRSPPLTDRGVVQMAFNNANGKIIAFESGRTYKLDNGLTVSATNVRGVLGNNAILEIDGINKVALKVTGTKTTGNAMPPSISDDLIRKEGNFFLEKLLVTSKNKFMSDGIVVEGLYKPIIKDVLIFRCKNGLTFKGMSRDVILDNLNIYDNAETGLLFDNVNIHQLNIHGGHISYNKNDIKFINGNVANVMFDSISAENSDTGGGYTESESIISFEETTGASAIFEVIIFSGCNIQEHGKNKKPLVNFDVSNGQIFDVIMGDTLLGNCGPDSVPFYGKKIRTLSINNVNTPSNSGNHSFVFEGAMTQVRVTGSNIQKPLNYNNATIGKMIIAHNTTSGFTLPDSNDGNILIKDNI